jgi:hypothetical protein
MEILLHVAQKVNKHPQVSNRRIRITFHLKRGNPPHRPEEGNISTTPSYHRTTRSGSQKSQICRNPA